MIAIRMRDKHLGRRRGPSHFRDPKNRPITITRTPETASEACPRRTEETKGIADPGPFAAQGDKWVSRFLVNVVGSMKPFKGFTFLLYRLYPLADTCTLFTKMPESVASGLAY